LFVESGFSQVGELSQGRVPSSVAWDDDLDLHLYPLRRPRSGAALYAVEGAAQEIHVILEGNASWTLPPDLDLGSIVPTGRRCTLILLDILCFHLRESAQICVPLKTVR